MPLDPTANPRQSRNDSGSSRSDSSEIRSEDHFGCSVTPYLQNLLRTADFSHVDLKDWAIVDSGATSYFLVTEAPVVAIVLALNPLTVTIPNGFRVQSTHDCKLAAPELPEKERIGNIVPGLTSHSVVSVIQL